MISSQATHAPTTTPTPAAEGAEGAGRQEERAAYAVWTRLLDLLIRSSEAGARSRHIPGSGEANGGQPAAATATTALARASGEQRGEREHHGDGHHHGHEPGIRQQGWVGGLMRDDPWAHACLALSCAAHVLLSLPCDSCHTLWPQAWSYGSSSGGSG